MSKMNFTTLNDQDSRTSKLGLANSCSVNEFIFNEATLQNCARKNFSNSVFLWKVKTFLLAFHFFASCFSPVLSQLVIYACLKVNDH